MLSHFDVQIKEIVRDVLEDTDNHRYLLLSVAEECCNQVTRPSGKLDAENYFVPLGEAASGWAEEMEKQTWPNFWVTVLNNVPDGPTLFYPPASNHIHARALDNEVPQYLCRTFDKSSSGWNSDSEITSRASLLSPETSRTDIFALKPSSAIPLLFDHLSWKYCSSDEKADNLMSWTSSFLFAIQYAIWRLNRHGRNPSDIKICMVDTRKFPKGQFARDICLLKTYQANAKQFQDERIGKFFDFRLDSEDYYNGEFLSQGKVSLIDRACVVSLEELIQAGLFELYPEFEDVEGGKKWANRALELRRSWSAERATSDREIQLALGIGRKCFSRFEPLHVAHVLLAFKSRKYTENFQNRSNGPRPKWADKPDEVRRYWIAMEAGKADIDYPGSMAWTDGILPQKKLREMFH